MGSITPVYFKTKLCLEMAKSNIIANKSVKAYTTGTIYIVELCMRHFWGTTVMSNDFRSWIMTEGKDLDRAQITTLVLLDTAPNRAWYPRQIHQKLRYSTLRTISTLETLVTLGLVEKHEEGTPGQDYLAQYQITNAGSVRAHEERSRVAKALSWRHR